MRATTLAGGTIDLGQDVFARLQSRLRGPVLLPGDSGYDESRLVWNAMIDRRPVAVVRCIGTADVVASVQFAREHGIIVCVKGGGHNIAGLAVGDGALMLDMSLMRGVWVEPEHMRARAQAGCLLGDVDRETQVHGLAAVLGFVSVTGIAGLTLGGGHGYLTRRWGWTADNLHGMDLVTADGRVVRASSDENADLFWALRGGGGNFGAVTGFDYALHRVGPEIVGGIVAWRASEAAEVLELYRTLCEVAPRELTIVALVRRAPPAAWLPTEMHGEPMVALLCCYSGQPEEGEKVVAAIKNFRKPVGDVLVRRPYAQMQSLLDATQPKGRRYYWKSEYISRVERALFGKMIEHAARALSPHCSVNLFQIEGALNELSDDHSPAGNRDARYVLVIQASWERPEQDDANIAWARDAWADMKSFSTGGTYINFLTSDEGAERTAAGLGKALGRLAEIKAKWDPQNMFRGNRNIDAAALRCHNLNASA